MRIRLNPRAMNGAINFRRFAGIVRASAAVNDAEIVTSDDLGQAFIDLGLAELVDAEQPLDPPE